MKTIRVSKEQLVCLKKNIVENEGYELGPYELAVELGASSFFGGLDHYEERKYSLTLHDRGCNGKSNDVKFVVPVKER